MDDTSFRIGKAIQKLRAEKVNMLEELGKHIYIRASTAREPGQL